MCAASLTRFSIDLLPEEPWRNGRGTTRTVAQSDLDGRTVWRISVADITAAAPFSRFDGLDRKAVLIRGGATLRGPGGDWTLAQVGQIARFPGEMLVSAELSAGPARLWNVMADSKRVRSNVEVRQDAQASIDRIGDGALLVLDGTAEVSGPGLAPMHLKSGDGLRFEDWSDAVALRFDGDQAHWLLTTFENP